MRSACSLICRGTSPASPQCGAAAILALTIVALVCVIIPQPIQAANTPAVPTSQSPRPSPAPGMSATPPGNFDPEQFAPLTSSTLPLENGQRIVMRVNSRPITWDEFIAQVRITGAAVYFKHPDKEANIVAALFQPLLEGMITQSLYNAFADDHHLEPEAREVQNNTRKLIERRDPQVTEALKRLSPDQIKSFVRASLIREKVNKYIGDRATSAIPTLAELTSFTAKMGPTTSPMTVLRARHIVVRATPDMTAFNIKDAEAKAAEIRAKLRDDSTTASAAGAASLDFFTAARQYSQDRFTAYLGGDLGYFRAGTMYPAVNKALEQLEPGDISPVIQSPVGFHIFQLTDRRDSNLVLQYDKWRRSEAIREWQMQAHSTADVNVYLKQ